MQGGARTVRPLNLTVKVVRLCYTYFTTVFFKCTIYGIYTNQTCLYNTYPDQKEHYLPPMSPPPVAKGIFLSTVKSCHLLKAPYVPAMC